MNGYLDKISVDMVQLYEQELYSFLKKTIFYLPFNYMLQTHINEDLIGYFLFKFSNFFIKYYDL